MLGKLVKSWLILASACLVGACGDVNRPSGVLWVELTDMAGVWFDIAHLSHPISEGCSNNRSLYRNPDDAAMEFLFECQLPDNLWYTVGGLMQRSTEGRFEIQFDEPQLEFLMSLSYWVLAADFEEGWVAIGEPAENWFWLLNRQAFMPLAKRDKILRELDERRLYGSTRLVRDVDITIHNY